MGGVSKDYQSTIDSAFGMFCEGPACDGIKNEGMDIINGQMPGQGPFPGLTDAISGNVSNAMMAGGQQAMGLPTQLKTQLDKLLHLTPHTVIWFSVTQTS